MLNTQSSWRENDSRFSSSYAHLNRIRSPRRKRSEERRPQLAAGPSPSASSPPLPHRRPVPPQLHLPPQRQLARRPRLPPTARYAMIAPPFTCTNCMWSHTTAASPGQVKHWSVHKIPCKESPISKGESGGCSAEEEARGDLWDARCWPRSDAVHLERDRLTLERARQAQGSRDVLSLRSRGK